MVTLITDPDNKSSNLGSLRLRPFTYILAGPLSVEKGGVTSPRFMSAFELAGPLPVQWRSLEIWVAELGHSPQHMKAASSNGWFPWKPRASGKGTQAQSHERGLEKPMNMGRSNLVTTMRLLLVISAA